MKISEQKFVQIIKENDGRIKHLCRSYVDRIDHQKDLYQEIVIQVWKSLPSFKGDAKMSTWIYRLAINTAISFVRRKKSREKYYSAYKSEKEGREDTVSASATRHEEDEQVDELYEAIGQLNASEKAIINMYLEEFSYQEISYVMDITENYVGVKLNRIKKKLSNILGD